jgi:hypothetical protein
VVYAVRGDTMRCRYAACNSRNARAWRGGALGERSNVIAMEGHTNPVFILY